MYALPGVKPNVRQCAEDVGNVFGIRTIYGVGARSTPGSDHPKGLALDFMCDVATGRKLRAVLIANWQRYGIKYIIHEQKILESPTGSWTSMADRGSVTANHFDHVHVSFNNVAVNSALGFTSDAGTEVWVDLDGDGKEDTTGRPMSEMPAGKEPVGSDLIPDWAKGLVDFFTFITDAKNWIRVGLFVAGLAALLIALYPLLKGQLNGR